MGPAVRLTISDRRKQSTTSSDGGSEAVPWSAGGTEEGPYGEAVDVLMGRINHEDGNDGGGMGAVGGTKGEMGGAGTAQDRQRVIMRMVVYYSYVWV